MKLKLPKIKKIKFNFSLKYFYSIVVLFVLVVAGYLSFYLYRNFYVTIAQTEQIILLKKEVAPDSIDINKVNSVLNALDKKTTTTKAVDYSQIKDPFSVQPSQLTIPEEPEQPETVAE